MSTWSRRSWAPVGYLPQDVELFAGTVADNIARLRKPDAEEVSRRRSARMRTR